MTLSTLFWKVIRSALFSIDPEKIHEIVLALLPYGARFFSAPTDLTRHPQLKRKVAGIEFPNPLGLAAGFDKNGVALSAWQALGFGFVEVGTVTAKAQAGNPKPRLFRLPQDEALFNRLGFNNEGARAVARRVGDFRTICPNPIPIGLNIGKSRIVSLKEAVSDYLESFSAVADIADYIVINVSSPNTPGLRDLQEEFRLKALLEAINVMNQKRRLPRPLFVKLSPDLTEEGALTCAEISLQNGFRGLIISNTTISREGLREIPNGEGGISGKPLYGRSTSLLQKVREAYQGRLSFIGVGGIMDPETARQKIACGADLIQTYTGFVYGGPGFPRAILEKLLSSGGR